MIAEELWDNIHTSLQYLLTVDTIEHVAKNTTTLYKKNQMANTHADNKHSSNQGAI